MMSPGREITAKDIMSGIISAANRKMHRHSKVSHHSSFSPQVFSNQEY